MHGAGLWDPSMIEIAIQIICVYAIPLIFAITLHEAAHGWAAKKLGDDTAWILGRVTANPVPINPRYFRHFNRDMMLTALAGPASNLLQAIGWAVVLKLVVMMAGGGLGFFARPFLEAGRWLVELVL